MSTLSPPPQSPSDEPRYGERVSRLEADVRHVDQRLVALDRTMDDGFHSLRNAIAEGNKRQPITAFAGLGALIMTLVFAFGSPLKSSDSRLQDRVDGLKARELHDAETRGGDKERFNTLHEEIASALQNRKDKDAKHDAARKVLDAKIDSIGHSVNNGLGVRIKEIIAPLKKDIEWLKEGVDRSTDGQGSSVAEQAKLSSDIARIQGLLTELTRRINDIDNRGSRRWNDNSTPK